MKYFLLILQNGAMDKLSKVFKLLYFFLLEFMDDSQTQPGHSLTIIVKMFRFLLKTKAKRKRNY